MAKKNVVIKNNQGQYSSHVEIQKPLFSYFPAFELLIQQAIPNSK